VNHTSAHPTRRALTLGALASAAAPAFAQPDEQRLLFIGNSLTYTNNLPVLVEAVFAGAGLGASAEMVAKPAFSLADHWHAQGREAHKAIAHGGWDFVVMQQGSSARPESRIDLRRSVKRFAEPIAAAGARPAIYCVWPRDDNRSDFDDVIESYRLAAEDIGAVFFPVGAAWQAAPRDIQLYSPDGLHPSVYGSYLAALVIFAVVSATSPVGLPNMLTFRDGARAKLPADIAATLQEVAAGVM
jgi:hypothetical protein